MRDIYIYMESTELLHEKDSLKIVIKLLITINLRGTLDNETGLLKIEQT